VPGDSDRPTRKPTVGHWGRPVRSRVVLAPIRVANGGSWWLAAAGASSSGVLPTANPGRGRRVTVAGAAARAKKRARRARRSESSSVPGGLISGASASRGIQRLLLLASRPATLTALRALWRSSCPAAIAAALPSPRRSRCCAPPLDPPLSWPPELLLSSRRSHRPPCASVSVDAGLWNKGEGCQTRAIDRFIRWAASTCNRGIKTSAAQQIDLKAPHVGFMGVGAFELRFPSMPPVQIKNTR
jgi:hypothetical protein